MEASKLNSKKLKSNHNKNRNQNNSKKDEKNMCVKSKSPQNAEACQSSTSLNEGLTTGVKSVEVDKNKFKPKQMTAMPSTSAASAPENLPTTSKSATRKNRPAQKSKPWKYRGKKGLTPYQGNKQVFGYFHCKKCNSNWTSDCSYANLWLPCNKCNERVYPHKQVNFNII